MGRNNADFFDGGASARTDSVGAPEASAHWDGPGDNATQGTPSENRFTGSTAESVPYEGTGK